MTQLLQRIKRQTPRVRHLRIDSKAHGAAMLSVMADSTQSSQRHPLRSLKIKTIYSNLKIYALKCTQIFWQDGRVCFFKSYLLLIPNNSQVVKALCLGLPLSRWNQNDPQWETAWVQIPLLSNPSTVVLFGTLGSGGVEGLGVFEESQKYAVVQGTLSAFR